MAVVLTIDRDAVLRTASLSPADAAAQGQADSLIADLQGALETELKAAALADGSLTALLTRSVTELIAAELLDQRHRAEGAAGTIQVGGVTVANAPDLAGALRARAEGRLLPYRRRAWAAASPTSLPVLGGAAQEALFGPTEAARHARRD